MSNEIEHDDAVARSPLPQFLRFTDLFAAGITSNWTHLSRLIRDENFPCGRLLSPNLRAWTVDEVTAWLATRPVERKKITPPTRRTKRKQEGGKHAA